MQVQTANRSFIRTTCTIVAAFAMVVASISLAAPAAGAVYSNPSAITMPGDPSGAASPYPSTISVAPGGTIADVDVTLSGITHEFPPDLEALLVGPGGQNVALFNNCGVSPAGSSITFDDAAPSGYCGGVGDQTVQPSATAFLGGAPAPAGPYGTSLSVFNGTQVAGVWKLFVYEEDGTETGTISGWSLDIRTQLVINATSPGGSKVGQSVAIAGAGFTGATVVKFNGIPAATFSVDSDTQVTATVPAGASTGPISITTPGGTTASSTDFVVRHARNVSITLNGTKAKGRLNVIDGFLGCRSQMHVKVQHWKGAVWKTVASVTTRSNGSYIADGMSAAGRYRAIAKKVTSSSGDVCLKTTSAVAS